MGLRPAFRSRPAAQLAALAIDANRCLVIPRNGTVGEMVIDEHSHEPAHRGPALSVLVLTLAPRPTSASGTGWRSKAPAWHGWVGSDGPPSPSTPR